MEKCSRVARIALCSALSKSNSVLSASRRTREYFGIAITTLFFSALLYKKITGDTRLVWGEEERDTRRKSRLADAVLDAVLDALFPCF